MHKYILKYLGFIIWYYRLWKKSSRANMKTIQLVRIQITWSAKRCLVLNADVYILNSTFLAPLLQSRQECQLATSIKCWPSAGTLLNPKGQLINHTPYMFGWGTNRDQVLLVLPFNFADGFLRVLHVVGCEDWKRVFASRFLYNFTVLFGTLTFSSSASLQKKFYRAPLFEQ